MKSDQSMGASLSGWAGHAGPESTRAYMHLFERVVARWAKAARPTAWGGASEEVHLPHHVRRTCLATSALSGVEVGVPIVPQRIDPARAYQARQDFALEIAHGVQFDSARFAHHLEQDDAQHLVRAIAEVFALARCVEDRHERSIAACCDAIQAFYLWARAARQPKHLPIQKYLARSSVAGREVDLVEPFRAWLDCHENEHVSLERQRPAMQLIKFLLRCGVPKASLVIVVDADRGRLPPGLAALGLNTRVVRKRAGRSSIRLQFVDSSNVASEAESASVSMVGLHWLMVLTGTNLLLKELI